MADNKVPRKPSTLAVESHGRERVQGLKLYWTQLTALTKKNLAIRRRSAKINLVLVLQAALFITLIWVVDKAVLASNQRRPAYSNQPNAVPHRITSIPDCVNNRYLKQTEGCYSVLYAPRGLPIVDQIMAAVADNNDPPLPRERIRGFSNASDIDAYLMGHPDTVLATVEFNVNGAQNIGFALQTNTSVQWFKGEFQHPNMYVQLPLQTAIEREAVKLLSGYRKLPWNVSIVEFPHPSAQSPSLLATFAPTFLFASIMFQFVLLLHDVVQEKESGVRRLMQIMGLRQSPLWLSWIALEGLLALIETCLLVGFAYAFQFNLFTQNAFALSFLLLFLTSLATMAFGFFVAALLRKASSAVPVGFFLFVVAWVFMIVIDFGFPYSPKYSWAAVAVFSLFPWSLLSKGIGDLAAASENPNLSGGISWADRSSYCQETIPPPQVQASLSFFLTDCIMPLERIFYVLLVQCFVYILAAIWADNVMPDENGSRRSLLFFLMPSYWLQSSKKDPRRTMQALETLTTVSPMTMDADVKQEADRVRRRAEQYALRSKQVNQNAEEASDGRQHAIEMFGLRKAYNRGNVFRKREFVAVKGNWLGIYEGECFCLLGPNGAGKSTTINCLTGVLPVTAGDAVICGEPITTPGGMDRIRQLMGVCPQFDVQYDRLTGREHLELYASIKGLKRKDYKEDIGKLLEEVKLTEAADVTAGAYSGGMKRRLSIAMALLGDPKVVFLDEPTTGLDPISRRHLWDLVDSLKSGRCIVLTTHSMEEADILGDRIGIMARGELRCIGTSLRLKSRFGSGYNISVRIVKPEGEAAVILVANEGNESKPSPQRDPLTDARMDHVKRLFMDRLGVKSADESVDYVHFLVPYENEDKLPMLLSYLKTHAEEFGISDVQLRLTPLEEVFLNVSRKAELEYAQVEGRYETLVLAEENIAIKVPIGADFISSPSGFLYHIKWAQDEKGALKLQDYYRDPYGNPQLVPQTTIAEAK